MEHPKRNLRKHKVSTKRQGDGPLPMLDKSLSWPLCAVVLGPANKEQSNTGLTKMSQKPTKRSSSSASVSPTASASAPTATTTSKHPFNFIQNTSRALKLYKTQFAIFFVQALILVAALAWNEAMKSFFSASFPLDERRAMWGKFFYALVVTVISVILVVFMAKAALTDERSLVNSSAATISPE